MIDPLLHDQKRIAFFHGRGPVWKNGKAGQMDFINLLVSVLNARGYGVEWVPFSSDVDKWAKMDLRHLHIVVDDMPFHGRNIFYCIPSYLHGFWYFDPIGSRNNSSIGFKKFCPEAMSHSFAKTFMHRLRTKFVEANRSKFDQDLTEDFTPEAGAICIFTQSFDSPKYYRHHMAYPDLIEGVIAHRDGRRVYIKPHPRQTLDETIALMHFHDPDAGIEVTNHSIHGLLKEAAVAVSLSSAVLLEAQMHRVPGIVGGEVDFHHNLVPIQSPAQIEMALKRAVTETFPFEKYLVFFFAQGMVQPHLQKKATAHIETVLLSSMQDGLA